MIWEQKRKEGVKIGYTVSSFDLLHAGHILMLAEAKSVCNWLVVGLIVDPADKAGKNDPVQTIMERHIQISAVKYVDEVVLVANDRDIIQSLLVVRPHIRILGDEYRDKDFVGSHLTGWEHYYNERHHSFSTSNLRAKTTQIGVESLNLQV